MKAPVYLAHQGTILVALATERTEAAPAYKFRAAKLHEEFAARVRVVMREHRHVGPSSTQLPAAGCLATYLPTYQGAPIYGLRELLPLGAARGLDPQFNLETILFRWSFTLHLLPAALTADPVIVEAIERNLEIAIAGLFEAQGLPTTFIPGDEEGRPGIGTDVAIVVETGVASGRQFVEIPPSA